MKTTDGTPVTARVLVIEDDEPLRSLTADLLEFSGYEVVTAEDGLKGLEEVRQRDRETPIFMITAYGSVEVAVQALKRGASDYFSKPWDNEKLLV